jgi:hypothetical protein
MTLRLPQDPIIYDFPLWCSRDYARTWSLCDSFTGVSLLAKDYLLTLIVKDLGATPTSPNLLYLTNQQVNYVTGILFANDYLTSGLFTIIFLASDLEGLTLTDSLMPRKLTYSLAVTYPDAIRIVYVRGTITLNL